MEMNFLTEIAKAITSEKIFYFVINSYSITFIAWFGILGALVFPLTAIKKMQERLLAVRIIFLYSIPIALCYTIIRVYDGVENFACFLPPLISYGLFSFNNYVERVRIKKGIE